MTKLKPIVLTIAGSDSSGGAGVQADIKTISATGSYAASVILALTAQNTLGVQAVYSVADKFVTQQLQSVFDDLSIGAVKIGMLHHAKKMKVVAAALKKYHPPIVVLDPVMLSKNGYVLMEVAAIPTLIEAMLPFVTLITPNLGEAELLLGKSIVSNQEQALAARQLSEKFEVDVLVKGGHFDGETASDVLYQYHGQQYHWFHAPRIKTPHTHGTGCSLSSAIASYLAQGYELTQAVATAKRYLSKAIYAGTALMVGHGCGPIDHFYFLGEDHE